MLQEFLKKEAWVYVAIAMGIATISLLFKRTYLQWLNTLTIVGFFYFAIGMFRLSWAKGDFAFLSYRKKRDKVFKEYKEEVIERRKDLPNSFLYASILVITLSFILNFFY